MCDICEDHSQILQLLNVELEPEIALGYSHLSECLVGCVWQEQRKVSHLLFNS